MTTILIALALVLWLMACAIVVAICRTAALADVDQADDSATEALEPGRVASASSRNPA